MSVNISKLKKNKIRKTFALEGSKIEIYNITTENKDIMRDLFLNNYNTTTNQVEIIEDKMVEIMYRNLTNIQFDTIEDLTEALKEPSHILTQIQRELTAIISEFATEMFAEQEGQIDSMMIMVEQAEMLKKVDKLASVTNLDKAKLEKDATKEMKKMVGNHKRKQTSKKSAGKKEDSNG